MQNKIYETIKSLGLSEKETAIYISLLNLGGAFPSRISKETGIKRSTVYDILGILSIKGLITEVKKNNKYYYLVESPNKLKHLSLRNIQTAKTSQQKLEEVLPEISGLYAQLIEKPKISYFDGHEDILKVYEDHIFEDKKYEMMGFVNVSELLKFFPIKKYREYVKRKEKLNMRTRGIIPNTEEDLSFKKKVYITADKKTLPNIKLVSKGDFPWKGDITIYGKNKISIVNFEKNMPTGIIIESQTIHDMMKMIFNLAWKGVEK